ncbi:MAG: hypothetical protein J6K19_05515 [Prevotella sp.]|nr:hypothetical protein [Prevotella sp.]
MKKYILLFILAVISLAMDAQTTGPNRMIVANKAGRYTSYNVNDIDSIGFATIEGTVAADVKVLSYTRGEGNNSDTIHLAVTKTPSCYKYKITVLPTNTANRLTTDLQAATYMEEQGGSQIYWDDFTDATMYGFDEHFKPATSYTVMTVAYDNYGTACEARKAEFTAPAIPLVGNPDVAFEFTDATPTTLTCKFTPNDDVEAYAICLFDKKGGAEEQFLMWGPMMGFDNIGDMIKRFSYYSFDGEHENTWTELLPSHEYEIAIQAWDTNGTYAPVIYAYGSTATKGGTGEAKVDITIGDFGQDPESGDHYQWIKFTPNDQTQIYHAAVMTIKGDGTDRTDEEMTEYLQSDNNPNYPPSQQDPYWDLMEEDNATWRLDPSTTYTAYAIAKNANNEWGPLTKLQFTTPATPSTAKTRKAGKKMPERMNKKIANTQPTMAVPTWLAPAKKTGIQIIGK